MKRTNNSVYSPINNIDDKRRRLAHGISTLGLTVLLQHNDILDCVKVVMHLNNTITASAIGLHNWYNEQKPWMKPLIIVFLILLVLALLGCLICLPIWCLCKFIKELLLLPQKRQKCCRRKHPKKKRHPLQRDPDPEKQEEKEQHELMPVNHYHRAALKADVIQNDGQNDVSQNAQPRKNSRSCCWWCCAKGRKCRERKREKKEQKLEAKKKREELKKQIQNSYGINAPFTVASNLRQFRPPAEQNEKQKENEWKQLNASQQWNKAINGWDASSSTSTIIRAGNKRLAMTEQPVEKRITVYDIPPSIINQGASCSYNSFGVPAPQLPKQGPVVFKQPVPIHGSMTLPAPSLPQIPSAMPSQIPMPSCQNEDDDQRSRYTSSTLSSTNPFYEPFESTTSLPTNPFLPEPPYPKDSDDEENS